MNLQATNDGPGLSLHWDTVSLQPVSLSVLQEAAQALHSLSAFQLVGTRMGEGKQVPTKL